MQLSQSVTLKFVGFDRYKRREKLFVVEMTPVWRPLTAAPFFFCVSAPSRSAGGQLSSSGLHDSRGPSSSSQFGARPLFSKAGGERDREREQRERLAQSSRLFCRPEHRGDIWNQQRRRSANYEA